MVVPILSPALSLLDIQFARVRHNILVHDGLIGQQKDEPNPVHLYCNSSQPTYFKLYIHHFLGRRQIYFKLSVISTSYHTFLIYIQHKCTNFLRQDKTARKKGGTDKTSAETFTSSFLPAYLRDRDVKMKGKEGTDS